MSARVLSEEEFAALAGDRPSAQAAERAALAPDRPRGPRVLSEEEFAALAGETEAAPAPTRTAPTRTARRAAPSPQPSPAAPAPSPQPSPWFVPTGPRSALANLIDQQIAAGRPPLRGPEMQIPRLEDLRAAEADVLRHGTLQRAPPQDLASDIADTFLLNAQETLPAAAFRAALTAAMEDPDRTRINPYTGAIEAAGLPDSVDAYRRFREGYLAFSAENPAWSGQRTQWWLGGPEVDGVTASGLRMGGGFGAMMAGAALDPVSYVSPAAKGQTLLSRMGERFLTGAGVNVLGDVGVQGLNLSSGVQREFDPLQTAGAGVVGGAFNSLVGPRASPQAGTEAADAAAADAIQTIVEAATEGQPSPRTGAAPTPEIAADGQPSASVDTDVAVRRVDPARNDDEAYRLAFENAGNTARANLRAQGVLPSDPRYNRLVEAERARILDSGDVETEQPPAPVSRETPEPEEQRPVGSDGEDADRLRGIKGAEREVARRAAEYQAQGIDAFTAIARAAREVYNPALAAAIPPPKAPLRGLIEDTTGARVGQPEAPSPAPASPPVTSGRFQASFDTRAPMRPNVSRETSEPAASAPRRAQPLPPRNQDSGAVPLEPRRPEPVTLDEATIRVDVGDRIVHRDRNSPEEIGDLLRFSTREEAETASRGVFGGDMYDRGFILKVEQERQTGAYFLRLVPRDEPPPTPPANVSRETARRATGSASFDTRAPMRPNVSRETPAPAQRSKLSSLIDQALGESPRLSPEEEYRQNLAANVQRTNMEAQAAAEARGRKSAADADAAGEAEVARVREAQRILEERGLTPGQRTAAQEAFDRYRNQVSTRTQAELARRPDVSRETPETPAPAGTPATPRRRIGMAAPSREEVAPAPVSRETPEAAPEDRGGYQLPEKRAYDPYWRPDDEEAPAPVSRETPEPAVDGDARARLEGARAKLAARNEATARRQSGAEANRRAEAQAAEATARAADEADMAGVRSRDGEPRTVDGVADWRHDEVPEVFARRVLDEETRPVGKNANDGIDELGRTIKANRPVQAVIDADGNVRAMSFEPGQQWIVRFKARAGLEPDAPTGRILTATRTATISGDKGEAVLRIAADTDDITAARMLRVARNFIFKRGRDTPDRIRLEIHSDRAEPQIFTGARDVENALSRLTGDLDRSANKLYGGIPGAQFLDPQFWGDSFQSAKARAQAVFSNLVQDRAETSNIGALATAARAKTPELFILDAGGGVWRSTGTENKDAYAFGQLFRRRARLKPVGATGNAHYRARLPLQRDMLNASGGVLLETGGGSLTIHMPETLNPSVAAQLRSVLDALVPEGRKAGRGWDVDRITLETFRENGTIDRRIEVRRIHQAIDAAEDRYRVVHQDSQLNIFGVFNPNNWKRNVINPSMRAIQAALDSLERSDPSRVKFWRDLGEALDQNKAQGNKLSHQVWHTVANLHDTLVVSDIGALRGLSRRYANAVFTPEEAALMNDQSLIGKNILEWMADQVGSEPGSGRVVPRAFEAEMAQDFKRFARRMENIMRALEDVDGSAAAYKRAHGVDRDRVLAEYVTNRRVRTRQSPPSGPMTPEMVRAANAIDRAFNDEWVASQKAGMDLGRRTDYWFRNFNETEVANNRADFVNDATDQYIAEGVDAITAAEKAAALWTDIAIPATRRLRGATSEWGGANPTKPRSWSASADVRMRRWYVNNVRDMAVQYGRRIAYARSFARRFGAKGEKLNTAFDAISRAIPSEADRDLVLWHMRNSLGVHTHTSGTIPQTINGALSWVQVFGMARFLGRTALLQFGEPVLIAAREGKGAITAFTRLAQSVQYYAEAVLKTNRAQAMEEIADLIGLTGAAAKEMFLDARLNGITGNIARRVSNNVMDSFGITWLTERQRVFAMDVGARMVQRALEDIEAGRPNRIAQAEQLAEYGIDASMHAPMLQWIRGLQSWNPATRNQKLAYDEDAIARAYRGVLHDFATRSILEPNAAETPGGAKSPIWRMAYSLTSFLHAFSREVTMRMATTLGRAVVDPRLTPQDRIQLLAIAPAFGAYAAAQIFIQDWRTRIFSSNVRREQTTLERELTNLSRIGAFGIYDVALNTTSSFLRYGREPAGLATGPYIAQSLVDLFKIFNAMESAPDNSPRTDRAEWQGERAKYNLVAPAAVMLMSQVPLPGGPVGLLGGLARAVGGAYITSSDAAYNYATSQYPRGAQVRRGGGRRRNEFVVDPNEGQDSIYVRPGDE